MRQLAVMRGENNAVRHGRLAILITLSVFVGWGCTEPGAQRRFRRAIEQVREGRSHAIAWGPASGITDNDLGELSGLAGLRYLVLDGTLTSDKGLVHIATLPDLQSLSLANCRVTDAGLPTLADLGRLRFLRLDGLPITDEGLKSVGRMTGLRYLSLYRCRTTDAGLTQLRGLHKLLVLSLDDTQVSDAGVRNLVPHLSRLRYLSLWRTAIASSLVDDLQAQRPELRVNR